MLFCYRTWPLGWMWNAFFSQSSLVLSAHRAWMSDALLETVLSKNVMLIVYSVGDRVAISQGLTLNLRFWPLIFGFRVSISRLSSKRKQKSAGWNGNKISRYCQNLQPPLPVYRVWFYAEVCWTHIRKAHFCIWNFKNFPEVIPLGPSCERGRHSSTPVPVHSPCPQLCVILRLRDLRVRLIWELLTLVCDRYNVDMRTVSRKL